MKVLFRTGSVEFSAEFNHSDSAREIMEHLPIQSVISRWGDELYFSLEFKASAANATMDVEVGDVAYWPQGKCLCVFFGPTPNSTKGTPVPASPVVIIGKVAVAPAVLRTIEGGETISVLVTEK
jgi:hypothetical protein